MLLLTRMDPAAGEKVTNMHANIAAMSGHHSRATRGLVMLPVSVIVGSSAGSELSLGGESLVQSLPAPGLASQAAPRARRIPAPCASGSVCLFVPWKTDGPCPCNP